VAALKRERLVPDLAKNSRIAPSCMSRNEPTKRSCAPSSTVNVSQPDTFRSGASGNHHSPPSSTVSMDRPYGVPRGRRPRPNCAGRVALRRRADAASPRPHLEPASRPSPPVRCPPSACVAADVGCSHRCFWDLPRPGAFPNPTRSSRIACWADRVIRYVAPVGIVTSVVRRVARPKGSVKERRSWRASGSSPGAKATWTPLSRPRSSRRSTSPGTRSHGRHPSPRSARGSLLA
jgi:hypothetical protein